ATQATGCRYEASPPRRRPKSDSGPTSSGEGSRGSRSVGYLDSRAGRLHPALYCCSNPRHRCMLPPLPPGRRNAGSIPPGPVRRSHPRSGTDASTRFPQRLWMPQGAPVCTASGDQTFPSVAPDGAGGTLVAWADQRSGPPNGYYAQHLNGAGTPLWTPDGVVVLASGATTYNDIVSDGAGGAI